jgi:hypothetical protein
MSSTGSLGLFAEVADSCIRAIVAGDAPWTVRDLAWVADMHPSDHACLNALPLVIGWSQDRIDRIRKDRSKVLRTLARTPVTVEAAVRGIIDSLDQIDGSEQLATYVRNMLPPEMWLECVGA